MSRKKSPWVSFLAIVPATAMAFLDQTILPVALPTIQKEFHATSTQLQWTVNAYILAISLFVLIFGKLSDRIGHKKGLLIGITGFITSSALCSLSQNIFMLIIARALQGMSSAFMFPSNSALFSQIFPPEKRGKAMGINVSIGSCFLLLGPLVGGYFTQVLSWHWIFWINIPIGLIGLFMISKLIPPTESKNVPIDYRGFSFFALSGASITLLFMQLNEWGIISFNTLLTAFIGSISLFLLIKREKKAPSPFLNLILFKNPLFFAINVSIFIVQFILMINVFRAIYFQTVLLFTPIETGVITSVTSIPGLFMAPIAGMLSDRFSPKLPITLGYISLIFSFIWLSIFSTPSLPILLIGMIPFGAGIPLIMTPSFTSVMSSVPKTKVGTAMGIALTSRMFAGTIGLALIHLLISLIVTKETITLGSRGAQIAGFSLSHLALGILLIAALITTSFLHKRKSKHKLPESPAEGWD